MKINRIHAIIGFLLVIIPLLGFTRGFKYGFSMLSGAVILYFAIVSIHAEIAKKHRNKKHDSFVENKPKLDSLKQRQDKVITEVSKPVEVETKKENAGLSQSVVSDMDVNTNQ